MCSSDKEATALVEYLTDKGVRVPEDVAVVGCDHHLFLLHDKNYTLTTFEYPYAEIARELVSTCRDLVRDPDIPPKKVEFRARFIQGTTS